MRHISLFTGAGGGEYAARLLGWHTVAYCESEEYPRDVIRARIEDGTFADAPIHGDIRGVDWTPYRGRVDIISGGWPCQPFSLAGKRRADSDERNMWPSYAKCVREVEPTFAFLENVPGLLSGSHGYFGRVLSELADLGFNAEWSCLSASQVGAPHKRDRLWVLATHPDRIRCNGGCEPAEQEARRSTARLRGSQPDKDMAYANGQGQPQQSGTLGEVEGWAGDSGQARGAWWSSEPGVGRVAARVANRSDRLKAIGNGQVSSVAALAFMGLLSRALGGSR